MLITKEVLIFCEFALIGVLIAIVFDFFRALRKCKKYNNKIVAIQDCIFWIITGVIIFIATFYLTKGEIRIYILIAMILGVIFYIGSMSQIIVNLFIKLIKSSNYLWKIFIVPIVLLVQIIQKFYLFFKKITKKYCNKVENVVFSIKKKVNMPKKHNKAKHSQSILKDEYCDCKDEIEREQNDLEGELCLNQTKKEQLKTYL